MKRLTIRTSVRLLATTGVVVAVGTGLYATVRVVPAVRAVREATEPLTAVGGRLHDASAWADRCTQLAVHALAEGDAAARAALPGAVDASDTLLMGRLLSPVVPDSVRIVLAQVGETASRLAVTLDEALALEELGRHAEALRHVEAARQLREAIYELAARAQVGGLARVLVAQREVEVLSRRIMWLFALWVLGSVVVILAMVRLVRRRIEAPLRELQDALGRMAEGDLSVQLRPFADDEIGALARQFNQMTAVLRSRAESQGQMAAASVLLADVAHAVNNPLMSIGATAEGRLADPAVPENVRRDLAEILAQTRRAARLLEGIVRFVRPPSGERLAVVSDVVRESVELLAFQVAADGVSCGMELADGLPPALADPQKVEHILVALLSNAHQALVRGGAAVRRMGVRTRLDGDQVCVVVWDAGPGVPADTQDRLFQPFASSRGTGHVGLGLYTARRLAREMGGDVRYEPSGEGSGAAFLVTLPAGPLPGPAPAAPATAGSGSLQGLRVLLVDDEPAVRKPLGRFLKRRGALVREAADGAEALALLAAEGSDIVVADLRMPGMDGAALYRALREKDPAVAERMIFLSGDITQLGDLDGGGIAPGRILPKPIELAEFERFLLQYMGF
jgi:signal transduction histidine kinase